MVKIDCPWDIQAHLIDPIDLGSIGSKAQRNRRLLEVLGYDPSQVEINYTSLGQPFLRNPGDFSLSHKHCLLTASTSAPFRVGCDLETVETHRSWEALDTGFSADERRLIDSLGVDLPRALGTLLIWSAKEALFKATGGHSEDWKLQEGLGQSSGWDFLAQGPASQAAEIQCSIQDRLLLTFCRIPRGDHC